MIESNYEYSDNVESFMFCPVKVEKGRKWKGSLAYHVSTCSNSFGGMIAKLWEPVEKKFVYANTNWCDEVEVDPAKLEIDKNEYIKNTINSTIEWCKSQKPSSSEIEINKFARNVLRKHHPEMEKWIDEVLPDQRDVAEEVEKTLNWALTLKSRPCMIYGHSCPGGKLYPIRKQLQIAYTSLTHKGIVKLDGFNDIWKLNLTIRGLGKYIQENPVESKDL